MSIKSSSEKNIHILSVSGNFDIYSGSPVQEWLEQKISESIDNIVVDLTDVKFLDSSALAILVHAMKKTRERGGDVRLCGLQLPVRMVLELTRLDKVFEIYPNQYDALASFTD